MTYDWGVGQGAQPNAPLPWIEANAKLILEGGEPLNLNVIHLLLVCCC